ncbi:hypothetical protein Dpoa2040_002041 [Dickeya sp. CFBP 2040]|nr:hypothetical protein [Dickeya sp. CFBP 2040]
MYQPSSCTFLLAGQHNARYCHNGLKSLEKASVESVAVFVPCLCMGSFIANSDETYYEHEIYGSAYQSGSCQAGKCNRTGKTVGNYPDGRRGWRWCITHARSLPDCAFE